MISFKCKMCGGDLHPVEGCTTVECEYCGTTQTIAGADNEKKANLFNRANHLRMASEFDRAAGMYESILADFPEEAEAYWGLCLCAYGIEYVDDPASGKKIPTCHRTQPESIMENANFEAACDYADSVARKLYREEAKAIDRLQKDILAIVAKEEPYDVFICYKETDESGSRTPDSVLGQDVYDALTAKGMKVFFARITLENKLGQQYEPYIYAALQSAKVMLAIGTCYDYYNAPWVKNEWSRYLDMAAADKGKTLIPCYKDIDAYDIPKEFRNLQAQDMNKLGWLQDLVRGVAKLCGKEDAPKQTVQVIQQVQAAPAQQGSVTIDSLMKRVRLFLEDGDFQSANEYINKVLDIDAEYAPAYISRVQAAKHLRKEAELGTTIEAYERSADWQKALRFATPEQKKQYEAWLRGSLTAREERRKLDHYNITVAQMKRAKIPDDYRTAAAAFDNMNGYRDSAAKAQECRNKANAILDEAYNKALNQLENAKDASAYKAAEKAFLTLKGHKDSAVKAAEAKKKGEALEKALLEKQEQERREREAAEAIAQKKKKKATTIALTILILIIAVACFYLAVLHPPKTYSKAQAELAAGNYDVATGLFSSLGDYKDSADMAQESQYRKGIDLMEAGEYDDATKVFNGISDYSDATDMAKESQYRKGVELMEDGQTGEALLIFRRVGDYKDAKSHAADLTPSVAGRISAGYQHTVGLKADGTVIAVGENDRDQCRVTGWGRNNIIAVTAGNYNTVGLKADGSVVAVGDRRYDNWGISDWTDVVAVAAGERHIVGLKTDGTVVAAPSGIFSYEYCDVSGWTDIVAVAAGEGHTVGLKADGTVVAVGDNDKRQCEVSGWTDIVAIAADDEHTIGLKADGTVVAVGDNFYGQGNVSRWTDIVAISTGYRHTVGLKADGTVVAAGDERFGARRVSDWRNIVAIAAGERHIVGLKADGTVVAVGDNEHDQCEVSDWDLW